MPGIPTFPHHLQKANKTPEAGKKTLCPSYSKRLYSFLFGKRVLLASLCSVDGNLGKDITTRRSLQIHVR